MNTRLILLLVSLTGHAVLSRPDSYESYEDLGLSFPYGTSSEEDSAEIPLQLFADKQYDPSVDGKPEEFFEKLQAYQKTRGFGLKEGTLEKFQAAYKKYLGEPLPEPTEEQKAKLDIELNMAELRRVNKLRSLHGAPPLEYSEKLAAYAQSYVDEMSPKVQRGEFPKFDHNKPGTDKYQLGENIATVTMAANDKSFPEYKGENSDQWYFAEIDGYKHNGNLPYEGKDEDHAFHTGHFTQVVWHDTKQMGCGQGCFKKSGGMKECNVVCNYYPAGNVFRVAQDKYTSFAKNVNMNYDERAFDKMKKEINSELTKTMIATNQQKRGY